MATETRGALVDIGLLAGITVLLATGLGGLLVGSPDGWWVVAIHGIVGLAFLPLLALKLARVWDRLPAVVGSRSVALSVALTVATLAALATGIGWVLGVAPSVGPLAPLVVHGLLGILVATLLAGHLMRRFHRPARSSLADRRAAIRSGGLLVAGALAWRAQGAVNRARALAPRRFTGSRETGSDAGNEFPVTSWVADDPDPIRLEDWQLRVDGRVDRPLSLSAPALDHRPASSDRAVLDCTSGWYSVHEWAGVRLGGSWRPPGSTRTPGGCPSGR